MWMRRLFPLLNDLTQYSRAQWWRDVVAALVVTFLLIPQSLAYALLAGLPLQMGLYASIVPLLLYALMGSSRHLSVGPVAIVSLMSASAVADIQQQTQLPPELIAIWLAILSGAVLLLLGVMRFGFITQILSKPVISGFMMASAILIALSQLKHFMGLPVHGNNLLEWGVSLYTQLLNQFSHWNSTAFILGGVALLILWGARQFGERLLTRIGISKTLASAMVKIAPMCVVLLSAAAISLFNGQAKLALVGDMAVAMPSFNVPLVSWTLIKWAILPAAFMGLVGYMESIAIGKELAAKEGRTLESNQELIALGVANIGSGLTGGFSVTAGFSRSVVNYEAGAATQIAGVLAAIGITFAVWCLMPMFAFLPRVVLAAIIIMAVLSMFSLDAFKYAWRFSKTDFLVLLLTFSLTLILGVKWGVGLGVLLSLVLYLQRTARPHMAEIGRVGESDEFRNIMRHDVSTHPQVLMLRPDESVYFMNAENLVNRLEQRVAQNPDIHTVIIEFSGINDVDLTAVYALKQLNARLKEQNICLHLSAVKGFVMDKLNHTQLLNQLTGRVYPTTLAAFLEQCQTSGSASHVSH